MASARGGSGDAAALVVASRTEVEAMQEAFFGFAVRAFFEDGKWQRTQGSTERGLQPLIHSFAHYFPTVFAVFNMGVFLIGDVIDEFERAAVKVCEESISRQRKGSRGAPAKAGPTDSNVHEEVAKGADTLWEVAMEAFEFVSTQMLAYNQRNTFAWPEGLTYAVVSECHCNIAADSRPPVQPLNLTLSFRSPVQPGGATGSGAGSHTMLYTATQEAELDTAIAVLEEKLAKVCLRAPATVSCTYTARALAAYNAFTVRAPCVQERRRKRTLLWLQQMLHKRVPQAEDALKSLEAAVRTLDDGEGEYRRPMCAMLVEPGRC